MNREFEIAIAQRHSNLQGVKQQLINQARSEYNAIITEIESDYQQAQLIAYGLTQPKTSAAYHIAAALKAEYTEKHHVVSLAALLMADVNELKGDDKA